jgi:LacI family transcriptional regulator
LQCHGLPVDPALIAAGSFREAGGYEAMRTLLALSEPPTAVFAVNDLAAAGALRALGEAGLRAPHDVSVVGFNDIPMVAQTTPPLTTLRLPVHAMGVAAAERLLAILGGEEVAEPIVVPVELVRRGSTGPVASRQNGVSSRQLGRAIGTSNPLDVVDKGRIPAG